MYFVCFVNEMFARDLFVSIKGIIEKKMSTIVPRAKKKHKLNSKIKSNIKIINPKNI